MNQAFYGSSLQAFATLQKRELSGFANQLNREPEPKAEGGPEKKTSRLDRDDAVTPVRGYPGSKELDSLGESCCIGQQGSDVFENNAGFREVRYVSNEDLDFVDCHCLVSGNGQFRVMFRYL